MTSCHKNAIIQSLNITRLSWYNAIMAKKKSPTPTQPGSESTTGKTAEQPVEHKPGNGGDGAPRTKVLASGAIYDLDKGRIVGSARPNPYAINQTNTHEYHELSRQARLKAVYRGLATGTGRSNAHDAVEAIVARQAELAMDIERGRASTEAARFSFQAGELIQDRRTDASGGLSVTAHVSGDALAGLFSLLAGRRAEVDDEVVDGQAADVDE